MREKMALAIYMRRHNGKPSIPWAELAPLFRNELMLDADAALVAMREPTEPMLVVFHDRIQIKVDPVNRECSVLNDRALWSAMIDAAKEGS